MVHEEDIRRSSGAVEGFQEVSEVKQSSGLNSKMEKIIELLEKKEIESPKKFKLPFSIRGKKAKIKKGYAMVLLLRTTGSIDFKMVQVEHDTINLEDKYHLATANCFWRYKQFPVLIQPEWDLKPITNEYYMKTLEQGSEGEPINNILDILKRSQIETKKKMGGAWIIGLLIGGAVVAYIIINALGKKP